MTDEWMRHPVTGLTAPHHATQTDEQAQEAPVDVQDTQKAREERWLDAVEVTGGRFDRQMMLREVMALADEEVLAAITVARQDVAQCPAERDQARAEVERLRNALDWLGDQMHGETGSRGWVEDALALAAKPTPPAAPHAEDGARKALWDAIGTVYERHDHTRPLNHVNWIEWVEAVEKAGTFHPAPVADPSGTGETR